MAWLVVVFAVFVVGEVLLLLRTFTSNNPWWVLAPLGWFGLACLAFAAVGEAVA